MFVIRLSKWDSRAGSMARVRACRFIFLHTVPPPPPPPRTGKRARPDHAYGLCGVSSRSALSRPFTSPSLRRLRRYGRIKKLFALAAAANA